MNRFQLCSTRVAISYCSHTNITVGKVWMMYCSFLPDVLCNPEGLARRLLLPVQEVKWHLDHYRQILDKRKGKKANKSSGELT